MSDVAEPGALAQAQSPLVRLVAETVELQSTRSAWRGACAFHPDYSHGLYVTNDRFFCFSCGAGGNATDWRMRIHATDETTAAAHLMQGAPEDSADEHSEKPC
ncbi:CHC2 zinc finger domain-containing protein [Sphingomonas sp.]|uniref:CHC2 zinc finger domain-containing protein n=1 Tax=Sphingomonas sp. TaxID=28214 RepID=UPI002587C7AB|nr:CHC2 zinc finger domain-containing protein [Sphingomonas sp.]